MQDAEDETEGHTPSLCAVEAVASIVLNEKRAPGTPPARCLANVSSRHIHIITPGRLTRTIKIFAAG